MDNTNNLQTHAESYLLYLKPATCRQKVPLYKIEETDHRSFMEKAERLPYSDQQIRIYKKSLEEIFGQYVKKMEELDEMFATYQDIKALIKQRQPLANTMKYARVRRLEPIRKKR
jgi:hypothetical protein